MSRFAHTGGVALVVALLSPIASSLARPTGVEPSVAERPLSVLAASRSPVGGNPVQRRAAWFYFQTVAWTGLIIAVTPEDYWLPPQTLRGPSDWDELTFGVATYGRNVGVAVLGKVSVDWAEVVFADGTAQIVDFKGRTLEASAFQLLHFDDVRIVSHVTLMVRGVSPGASVSVGIVP